MLEYKMCTIVHKNTEGVKKKLLTIFKVTFKPVINITSYSICIFYCNIIL